MGHQQRAAATRRKLITAAGRLFAENGYLDTTPRDIAEAAGLTTGAFYYHFGSKKDLADAVVDRCRPDLARSMDSVRNPLGSGIATVIDAEFAVVDIVNSDAMHWIGFHLNIAIGHLGPSGRRSFQERVEAFTLMATGAFRTSELRDGMGRQEAAELLWIASTGAQLMSDALEESGAALFGRLGMAWKAALRTIVPNESLPRLEVVVDAAVARHGSVASAESAPEPGQVA